MGICVYFYNSHLLSIHLIFAVTCKRTLRVTRTMDLPSCRNSCSSAIASPVKWSVCVIRSVFISFWSYIFCIWAEYYFINTTASFLMEWGWRFSGVDWYKVYPAYRLLVKMDDIFPLVSDRARWSTFGSCFECFTFSHDPGCWQFNGLVPSLRSWYVCCCTFHTTPV